MNIELINTFDGNYTITEKVLLNRGIKPEDFVHYLNTSDSDINKYSCLNLDKLKKAAEKLVKAIKENKKTIVIVDSDVDGFTSSSILINYLHDFFPNWVESNVKWFLHDSKAHGLNDCWEYIFNNKYELVLLPDAGSNDIEQHKMLSMCGCDIICLDHHDYNEDAATPAVIINSQDSCYPNKALSGAGVTWQFCRFLDELLNKENADNYLDLVAVGLSADMMDTHEFETKHLINKGLSYENLKNPLIKGLTDKNTVIADKNGRADKNSGDWYFMGAAFYIAPLINAICRSGELEEKELIFRALLKHEASSPILSNKKGHKPDEMERVVDQALRTLTNVKNRQSRAEEAGMEYLEKIINSSDILKHKTLLFTIDDGIIDNNIKGLAANKLAPKYRRPCLILSAYTDEDGKVYYRGSARGYDRTGLKDFKKLCEESWLTEYNFGHKNAFGISIPAENIDKINDYFDKELSSLPTEPIYQVDAIYDGKKVASKDIEELAALKSLWSSSFDKAKIAINNLVITQNMLHLYSPDKNPTLKIELSKDVALMKFGVSQDLWDKLNTEGSVTVDIVCNDYKTNEFNEIITQQAFIEDIEIKDSVSWIF